MGGKILGSLFANMVFPAPGGPIRITLCPPAEAISMHRLMVSCPFTSEKSCSGYFNCFENSLRVSIAVGLNFDLLLKKSITSSSFPRP